MPLGIAVRGLYSFLNPLESAAVVVAMFAPLSLVLLARNQ